MQLSYPSILGINSSHSRRKLVTTFSSSSLCSRPSIVFLWLLQFPPRIPQFTPHLLRSQTNTVFSTSWSSIEDPSYQMLRRRTLLRYVTLPIMSGRGVGQSAEHGPGSLVLQSLWWAGLLFVLCGCGARLCRWSWRPVGRKCNRSQRSVKYQKCIGIGI